MKRLSLLLFILANSLVCSAVTITAIASGNWWETTTWDTGTIPTTNDDVIIPTGFTIDVGTSTDVITSLNLTGTLNCVRNVLINAAGTFTINSGGRLIINNTLGYSTSLFQGTEDFKTGSIVEIKRWINITTAIPGHPTVNNGYHHLIVNVDSLISGTAGNPWQNAGSLSTTSSASSIRGNLEILNTGTPTIRPFTLGTTTGTATWTVGGNFTLSNTASFRLAALASASTLSFAVFTVKGNYTQTGTSIFDYNSSGSASSAPVLVVEGDFSAALTSDILRSGSGSPIIRFNKTSGTQQVSMPDPFSTSSIAVQVGNGTTTPTVELAGNLSLNSQTVRGKITVDKGATLNQGAYSMTIGAVDVKGGTWNGSGSVSTNNIISAISSTTSDPTTRGTINYSIGTFTLTAGASSQFMAGSTTNGGGIINLTNGATVTGNSGVFVGITGVSANPGIMSLCPTCLLSGSSSFTATMGTLKIGSPDGITTAGTALGNIQTTSRSYTNGTSTNMIYEYNGTAAQVTGNGFPSVNANSPLSITLKINNSNGVTLSATNTPGAFTGNSSLDLTSGKLTLGSNDFIITSGGTITNATSSSYVVTDGTGTLKQTATGGAAKTFPIGASTSSYDPAVLTPTTTSEIAVKVSSTFTNAVADPTKVMPREWDITPVTPSSTLMALTHDAAATAPAGTPLMGHYTGGAWNTNDVTGPAYDAGTRTYSGTCTTFSPFGGGIAGGFATVLTVDFTTIKAIKNGSVNNIAWGVANEQGISQYQVERSADNRTWEVIGTVKANKGTAYNYTDNTPLSISYYRVRSEEISGAKGQVSKVVTVVRETKTTQVLAVSPNPTQGELTVQLAASKAGKLTVTLTDMVGRMVQSQNVVVTEGSNSIQLNLNAVPAGLYIMSITDGNTIINHRITKQ